MEKLGATKHKSERLKVAGTPVGAKIGADRRVPGPSSTNLPENEVVANNLSSHKPSSKVKYRDARDFRDEVGHEKDLRRERLQGFSYTVVRALVILTP